MLVMLLIIMDVCQIRRVKWVTGLLVAVSTLAFLLAASGDWLGLYYKAVSIETVNGMTRLIKDYGPLHILYTVYLLSYFILMVAVILHAAKMAKLASPKYAVFLVAIALCNLMVWAVEQFIDVDFEFLSVSYIVTEVMLLLIFSMLRDYGIVQPGGAVVSVQMLTQLNTRQAAAGELPPDMENLFHAFAEKVKTLSSAERRILNYYIEGHDTADIPDLAFISIHTVKKHNRSIYQKLGVASRDELMLYIELFRCCDRLEELTDAQEETELS
jgi:DNA-binding CsgD family transcriptional regulator